MLHGYDVSGFQGPTIPTCDFVFIKATEGSSYTSGEFHAQWSSAAQHAKARGAYHFARPEESSGASQADRFLAVVRPGPRDSLWLDLEVSRLSQSATNAWAKEFADRLRAEAPGNVRGIYMGAGYASSGTGRGLSAHFQYWWYPQYPSAYQLTAEDHETRRAANRTSYTADRSPIAAMTSSWPPAMTPWLPSGLTCGWSRPDIWQFTDNWHGLDASITPLTLAELTAGSTPTPQPVQEDDVVAISSSGAEGTKQTIEAGKDATLVLNRTYDDGHKFRHGNLILADGWYKLHATAQVSLSGLAAGDVVRLAWERTSPDGKTAVDEPLSLDFTADGDGTVKALIPWQMEVTSKLAVSLKVYNKSATKALTVDGAVLECDFFKVA